MKNFRLCLLMASALFVACDDDTSTLGIGVMPEGDNITAHSQVFDMTTTTVQVDSVLANTSTCYLGSVVDPEMKVRTTCDFLAQFHVPDNFQLPQNDVICKDANGEVYADSCDIRVYFDEFYGDSLAVMKLLVQELDTNKVMEEGVHYYTNLDAADYVNTESTVRKSLTYAVKDLSRPDSETNGTSYYRNIVVKLPTSYGTFLLKKYYENPALFANSYQFIHHVCPGFYFKSNGGVGSMITTNMMGLNVYFSYHSKTAAGNDTIIGGMQRMGATDEVIQNTHIDNDYPGSLSANALQQAEGTFIKTPTGLFTEATLPVSEIVAGEHYADSINQAQVVLRRYNNTVVSAYSLPVPETLLMVRKSQMNSFFEKNELPNGRDSYLASYSSTNNVYQFSNIAQLITLLKNERDKGAGVQISDDEAARNAKYAVWEAANPDWNKVMLVPVLADYSTASSTTSASLLRVQNNLGLSSARLEGGKDTPIQVNVIYGRFSR